MVDIARPEGVHNNHCYVRLAYAFFKIYMFKKQAQRAGISQQRASMFGDTIFYNAQRQVTLN